ncbi:MAG: hypothetical protein N2490_02155 [Ignavibacteria bacterium]|nr:hypothetical protein [Ignavibacteria bacterium]
MKKFILLILFLMNYYSYSQNIDAKVLLGLGLSSPVASFSDENKTGFTTSIMIGAFENPNSNLSYCFGIIYNNFAFKDNNKSYNYINGKYDGNLKIIGLDAKIGIGNFNNTKLINYEVYLSSSNFLSFYPDKVDSLKNVTLEGGIKFKPYVGLGGAIYLNLTNKFSIFADTRFNWMIGSSGYGGSYIPILFGISFRIK